MIDFPIVELLDDRICLLWSECRPHPEGFACPHCRSPNSRVFRHMRHLPAYRRRDWDGYDTLMTGTAFEKTRQRPATLALLLQGVAKGESTARLVQEPGVSRKQPRMLRQRVQPNLNSTAPLEPMAGTTFEADEPDQNAGETSTPHRDPVDTWACAGLIAENGPPDRSTLDTEERPSDRDPHPAHVAVRHSHHASACDDDGDNRREAYGHTCIFTWRRVKP